MKFVIDSKEFTHLLEKTSKALPSKSYNTEAEGVLLEVENTKLYLTVVGVTHKDQDLQQPYTYIASIGLEDIESEGKVCLEVKSLLKYLKKTPQQPITIQVSDTGKLVILTGNGKSEWVTKSVADFEHFVSTFRESLEVGRWRVTSTEVCTILLHNILNVTLPVTSTNSMKPAFNGVNVKIEEDELIFTATNGWLLFQCLQLNECHEHNLNVTIPTLPLCFLQTLLKKQETFVDFEFDKKSVDIILTTKENSKFVNHLLTVPLIQEAFPKLDLPKKSETAVTFQVSDVLEAVDRVLTIQDKLGNTLVGFTAKGFELKVSSMNEVTKDKASERMYVESIGDSDFETSFRDVSILQALKLFKTLGNKVRLGKPSPQQFIRLDAVNGDIGLEVFAITS